MPDMKCARSPATPPKKDEQPPKTYSDVRGSKGPGDGESSTKLSAKAPASRSVPVPVYRLQACRLCERTLRVAMSI